MASVVGCEPDFDAAYSVGHKEFDCQQAGVAAAKSQLFANPARPMVIGAKATAEAFATTPASRAKESALREFRETTL
ncbi:hypothetical protein JCM19238_3328 [Vibrio ponticus]|nr:hypothetical protein JCM19238_3328 [Vibrio ponticus]